MKVLIPCTDNSCRSQMAHGFLQSFDPELEVFSAGTKPAESINPRAVEVMKKAQQAIARKRSRVERENGNTILSCLANIAGRGKYAEIEKRNRELEESVPREKERLQQLFSKQVIDAIIDFARSAFGGNGRHGDIFTNEEAAGIKDIMDVYAENKEERFALGNWLVNFARDKGKLTEAQTDRAYNEVDDVAEGRYDWRIERGGNKR